MSNQYGPYWPVRIGTVCPPLEEKHDPEKPSAGNPPFRDQLQETWVIARTDTTGAGGRSGELHKGDGEGRGEAGRQQVSLDLE